VRLTVITSSTWIIAAVVDDSELCKKPKRHELRGIIRRASGLRAAYVAASAAGDILVEIGG